jgi:hypothetical protein
MNKKQAKKKTEAPIHWAYLLAPAFLLAIYPLIARLYLYDSGLEAYDWFDFSTQVSDLFLHWKMVALETAGLVMCLLLFLQMVRGRIRYSANQVLYLLLAYAALAFLSTCFSEYPGLGWHGAYEQFESVFCTLTYVLIVCYICLLAHRPESIRILLLALAIGSFFLGLIGFFQFFGLDVMTSSIGKALMVPARYRSAEMTIRGFEGLSYMTLYNPNYVSSYVCLVLPVLGWMVCSEKKMCWRILAALDMLLLYVSALGSRSDSARWGLSLVLLLSLALGLFHIRGWQGKLAYGAVCILAIAGIQAFFLFGADAVYTDTAASTASASDDDAIETEDDAEDTVVPISEHLRGIDTGEDALYITYDDDGFYLNFSFEDGDFSYGAADAEGVALDVQKAEDDYLFTIEDLRFGGIQFCPISYEDGSLGLQLRIDGKEWNFINGYNGESGYFYYNEFGKFDKITTAENYLFRDNGSFGNGRGFIWGETLPLLKHYVLLGSGADTFTMVFPQDNYVEKYLNGYETMVIGKPHNMYLQIAVQYGMLALLLFLAAVVICLYRTWKAWVKAEDKTGISLQAGIALGILGYLFTGLVNDVTICVAPIFWCLFGILVAMTVPERKKR